MPRFIQRLFRRSRKGIEIDPDQIFMDSHNVSEFDTQQFEGRLDMPISRRVVFIVGILMTLVTLVYTARVWNLQVVRGEVLRERSEKNNLRHTPIFAARGAIKDRKGELIAWNAPAEDGGVLLRKYSELSGLAHVLGYVQYPTKDSRGFYFREDFIGVDGVEKLFNSELQGANGTRIVEVDARGKIVSENTVTPPQAGETVTLSIDAKLQNKFFESIKEVAQISGFRGGAGVIMDVTNGEVLALTSYPEFDPDIMSRASDRDTIRGWLNSPDKPFLDRAIDGVYAPGSIVKSFLALAALNEGIISPEKEIVSTGQIAVQNPYNPDQQTIFRDWKVHGATDMREAIAVSSDVYFYSVGGGYKDQKGLGITKIDEYTELFGFGKSVKAPFFEGAAGLVPTPEWKRRVFNGEVWTLGNTYHTSIGQFGFQVSPIQAVRATAAIATGGVMRSPTILKGGPSLVDSVISKIPPEHYKVVQEGMRLTVTAGTARSLDVKYAEIAAKSGTAEVGANKENLNSWLIGYWPASNPKYAFAVVLEKSGRTVPMGSSAVIRRLIDWMNINTPEYFYTS